MNNLTAWSNKSFNAKATGTVNHTHIILLSILFLWSLIGNILVIAVVLGNRNLRTNFNYLIVNMAVSDLFIPLVILPLRIVQKATQHQWLVDGHFGVVLCKLCYFLIDITPAVSVFSLVIIAVNRYISIAYPMKSQIFSRKKSRILISSTWIVSMLLFSPFFYTFRLRYQNGFIYCTWSWYPFDNKTATQYYYSIITAVTFVIPLIAIIVMYSLMVYGIKANSKDIATMLNDKQARKRRDRNKNIFYVSIIIVGCFVLLWGPYTCFAAISFSGNLPKNLNLPMVVFVVQYLSYLNSALNPCIYFIFLKHFRQGLRNLGKKTPRKTSSTSKSRLASYHKESQILKPMKKSDCNELKEI